MKYLHAAKAAMGLLALVLLQLGFAPPAAAQSVCPAYNASTLPAGINLLEFPAAWLKVCGTAYVGVLDNGIYAPGGTAHPSLNRARKRLAVDCTVSPCPEGFDQINEQPGPQGANNRGHGTHVAGIIGGTYTVSDPSTGAATVGGCRGCSLEIVTTGGHESSINNALDYAKYFGSQVVNMSKGQPWANANTFCISPPGDCSGYKSRLNDLAARDVVVVAASGNTDKGSPAIEFPAMHPTVIAVGGIDGTSFWTPATRTYAGGLGTTSFGSASGPEQWVVAPAVQVRSLFYNGGDWVLFSDPAAYSCRDQNNVNAALPQGFGNCTGTSMSAPQVTAIAALMKSADPLMTYAQAREILRTSASSYPSWSSQMGYGYPSAAKAVTSALGGEGVKNRITPLFALFANNSPAGNFNHVYTVVPQMAMSAIEGRLPPQPAGGTASYTSIGTAVPGYAAYPGCSACAAQPPRAIASVFTTHVNPGSGPELEALYRMSWKCTTAFCPHVSHVNVLQSEISGFNSVGYEVDGIEGFIYSKAQSPQPAGTVKLCRKYDAARDDYLLFQGSGINGGDCSATSDGFSGGSYTQVGNGTDWLGYVLPVQQPGPVGAPQENVAFVNGGMETPAVSSWSAPPTGWAYNNAATVPNSYIGSPVAPEGTQVGFFWSNGYLRQAVNLTQGTAYIVTFKAAVWPGYAAGTMRIRVNGVDAAASAVSSGVYNPFQMSFTASYTGAHTIEFGGDPSPQTPFLLDDVKIRVGSTFANGGMESPSTTQFGPVPTDWYGYGSVGVASNSAMGYPPAPEGVQAVYYHTSAQLGQYVALAPGAVTVRFRSSVWPGSPAATGRVRIGAEVQSFTVYPQSWGTYALTFANPVGGLLAVDFLADASVASWIMIDDAKITR